MVVPVCPFELLGGHAEEPCRLPEIRARLHLPGSCGMAKRVRRHIGHAAIVSVAPESLVHVQDRFAIPFDAKALSATFPAAHMRQKARRQGYPAADVSSCP
jgi:hypothetical protein